MYLIDDVPLRHYFFAFLLVVVTCAAAYSLLTPYGHGVGKDLKPLSALTFLDGVYFSVVTISSLGYGDMHPVGFSKLVACFEVLFGLAWIGVLIAKLTSRRLSYHVARLFSTDAQRQLEQFSTKLLTLRDDLRVAMGPLARAYQNTPGTNPGEDKDKALHNFNATVIALHSTCFALRDYLSSEVEQGDYFSIVPSDPVRRVGDAINDMFFNLGQLIISLTPQARADILDRQTRQRISETLSSQKIVCQVVKRHSKDEATTHCFLRVRETCEGVLERYFTMPATLLEAEQPDQLLAHADAPQEPPE